MIHELNKQQELFLVNPIVVLDITTRAKNRAKALKLLTCEGLYHRYFRNNDIHRMKFELGDSATKKIIKVFKENNLLG